MPFRLPDEDTYLPPEPAARSLTGPGSTDAPAPPLIGTAPAVSVTPSAGKGVVLDASGGLPASVRYLVSGFEYAYSEITSNASITATTSGTANTVVTAAAVTFDGSTAVMVEFWAVACKIGTSEIKIELFDGSTSLGLLVNNSTGGTSGVPTVGHRRLTPTAGTHTYSIRAYVDGGTGTVYAGAGGATTNLPAFIRITRA